VTQDDVALAELLAKAGVGWLLEGKPTTEQRVISKQIADEIRLVEAECRARLKRPIDLRDIMTTDVTTYTPLIQTFATPMTAPIRAMVYCVLSGARIRRLSYAYEERQSSRLKVIVAFADDREHEFDSAEHWDAEVLHHFGIAKLGERPLLDGYFAFRK
jgi:hypothetical protein